MQPDQGAPCPVIFDLDGTLIDSAPDIHAGVNRVLVAHGFDPLSFAQIRSFIGRGVGHLMAQVVAALGKDPAGPLTEELLAAFEVEYEKAVDLTAPYPNMRAALTALISAGHPLAICTNKPLRPTLAVLEHLALTDCFKTIIGGDSLPVKKPDPAPLLAALQEIENGTPALYVGDSEVDAATAQAAGMPFALYANGYRKTSVEDIKATYGMAYVFEDFAEFPQIVEQFAARSMSAKTDA